MSLQMCFSGATSPPPALNIPSSIDQKTSESDAMSLMNSFSLFSYNKQCNEAIMPFLCLSIFSLCDSSTTLHTILRQDCLDIRDDICASEWSEIKVFLGTDALPVCEDLQPVIMEDCIGITSSKFLHVDRVSSTGGCRGEASPPPPPPPPNPPTSPPPPNPPASHPKVLTTRELVIDTQKWAYGT